MKAILIVSNGVLGGILLITGWMYPSLKDWSYLASGTIAVHLGLELMVSESEILDAAKISALSVQGLSTLGVTIFLLLYSLDWGNWLFILAVACLGLTFIASVITLIIFKNGGVADGKPLGFRDNERI